MTETDDRRMLRAVWRLRRIGVPKHHGTDKRPGNPVADCASRPIIEIFTMSITCRGI